MRASCWSAVVGVALIACCCGGGIADEQQEQRLEKPPLSTDVGSPRILTTFIFPFFRQYQQIDIGANLNNLKSANTATFFIVRDLFAYFGLILTHLLLHYFFWAGKLSRDEDVPVLIRVLSNFINPTATDQISRHGEFDDPYLTNFDKAEDKIIRPESFDEVSANGLFNFFADPNPSFRNLIMNTGFVAFQLILWFLPTFFWPGEPLPTPPTDRIGDPPIAEDKIGNLLTNFQDTSPVAVYNRLLCPQCVTQNIAIATLIYVGKLFWWWFFTALPDFNSFQIRPTLGRGDSPRALNVDPSGKFTVQDTLEDIYEAFLVTARINLRNMNQELEDEFLARKKSLWEW